MQNKPIENPVFQLISDLFETDDLDVATAMLNAGEWFIISVAKSKTGYLFALAKFDLERLSPNQKA